MHQSNTPNCVLLSIFLLTGQLSFTSTVTKGIVGAARILILIKEPQFLLTLSFFFALTYWPSLLTLWLQVFLKWRFGYLLCGCGLIGVVTALWRDIQPCVDSFVMLLHIGFCPFSCLSWMTIVKGPLCSAFFAIHFLGTTCASG